MPLDLIAPGKRKNNRFYIARGTVRGRQFEVSTKTTDKAVAERFAAELTNRIINQSADHEPERKPAARPGTFREAAERYLESHPGETGRLRPIIKDIGAFQLTDVTRDAVLACANRLCSNHKASSKNRKVVTPISSVMHYAADNGWCNWVTIKRFKEAAPPTRALRPEPAADLIDEAPGTLKVLMIFLFSQGMRISDALRLTWERLDLDEGQIYVHISKTDEWKWKALHPDAQAAFATMQRKSRGPVFPWTNRWQVYRELKPVVEATGIKFTPHMARHSLGTWLGAKGNSLKTIMDILNHADPKSSIRYQMTELPEQRAAFASIGSVTTPRPRRRKA